MSLVCLQQVRVVLVEVGERHNNEQTGSTTRHATCYEDIAHVGRPGVSARMLRGCCEETAPVEFMLDGQYIGLSR